MHVRDFITKVSQSFTAKEAAIVLNYSPLQTTKILYKWRKDGWIQREARGVYTVIPVSTYHTAIDDPWTIIPKVLPDCEYYICGWSACEYFGLTEQIFNDISVATLISLARKSIKFKSGQFIFFTTPKSKFFATQIVWRGNQKMLISDIHKTVVDMVLNPSWGGGIVHVYDCLKNYLKHEDADLNKIIEYGEKLGVRVFYNRLGFYLEQLLGRNDKITLECHNKMTSGYNYLDTKTKGGRYISFWKIIIPKGLNLGKNE